MRRSLLAIAAVAAIGLVLAMAGCGKRKSVLLPDLPPETSVFVQGPVDPVSHRIHLYWFGTDPDGNVVAYEMRFVPSGGSLDPPWGRIACALPGRCTDSVFTVFTGDSALIHTQFEIRAVDNTGQVDPTPAVQRFVLGNLAPTVRITTPLGLADTTFASVTMSWEVNDPDGGGPGLRYRIWLDRNQASYDSTTATTFTVPSARFLLGGTYITGPRTLYIQAVDDGGRSGPVDSTRWFVRAPAAVLDPVTHRGRLLLIDDSGSTTTSNLPGDTLYANTVARDTLVDPYREGGPPRYVRLAPGTFSILRLETSNPFRTASDLMQTFRLFDAVVWYRGYERSVSPTLQSFQDSIGAHILNGGRLYLEGLYLIEGHNSFGSLREDFVTRYLNCRRLFQQGYSDRADSTVGIGTIPTASLRSALYADTVMSLIRPETTGDPGIRGFVVNDTSQVALWARAGALESPTNTEDLPFAVTVNRAPGRLIVVAFPIRALGAPPPSAPKRLFPSFRLLARLLFDRTNGLLAP